MVAQQIDAGMLGRAGAHRVPRDEPRKPRCRDPPLRLPDGGVKPIRQPGANRTCGFSTAQAARIDCVVASSGPPDTRRVSALCASRSQVKTPTTSRGPEPTVKMTTWPEG